MFAIWRPPRMSGVEGMPAAQECVADLTFMSAVGRKPPAVAGSNSSKLPVDLLRSGRCMELGIAPKTSRRSLFKLDICGLDDAGELGEIRLDQRRKLVRRGNERFHSLAQQLLPDVGHGQNP